MTAAVDVRPSPQPVREDVEICHLICRYCWPDGEFAMCGEDVRGTRWGRRDDPVCVVCEDLDRPDVHGWPCLHRLVGGTP